MEKKSRTKYFESYSVGDANCDECGKQERIHLAKVADRELCYSCAKTERSVK